MRWFRARRAFAGAGLSVVIIAVGMALATSATGVGAAAGRLVGAVVDHHVTTGAVAAGKPGGGGTSGTSGAPGLTIVIGPSGTIVAKGAGIDVTVTISCDFPSFGGGVSATQRSGNSIAQANTSLPNIPCDGTPHTVVVGMQASNAPFKRGTALVDVNVFSCSIFCGETTAQATVRLVNG